MFTNKGPLYNERERKPRRAFPICLLKCHLQPSKVISYKNLWEKVESDKLIGSGAGSGAGLFNSLISLVGCVCCRLSPEMPGLYQRDGKRAATATGGKGK